jgi:hypothetical protein
MTASEIEAFGGGTRSEACWRVPATPGILPEVHRGEQAIGGEIRSFAFSKHERPLDPGQFALASSFRARIMKDLPSRR